MRNIRVQVILVLVAALTASPVLAEKVILKDGQQYEGELVKKTHEYIHLKTESGVIRILLIDITEADGIDTRTVATHQEAMPPLNGSRIAGELAAGAFAGSLVSSRFRDLETGREVALAFAAYGVATSAAVYAVGNLGNETGSLTSTIAAGLAGVPVGIGFVLASGGYANPPQIIFIAPPVLATMAFNSTRRYKSPPVQENGLFNVRDGDVFAALPSVEYRFEAGGDVAFIQKVNLLSITF